MERERRDDRRRNDSRDEKPARRDNRSQKDYSNQAPRRDDRDRSRSPPRRDQRSDNRHRQRSPPRGPARGAPPSRGRDSRPSDRGTPRQPATTFTNGKVTSKAGVPEKPAQQIPEDEDSEAEMARIMGFKGFRTTKNTKVPGNDKNYGVNKRKKSEYRQYMNRVGGFNRPLDAMS